MSQTRHFARDDISSLQLLISNWWTNGSTTIAEASPGSPMTVTASVSLDRTTWYPVTWSGLSSGTVADGSNLLSDALAISIANGTQFYIRVWKSCAGGITYAGTYSDSTSDELFMIGTSVADKTTGGTFTGNANSFFGGPTAVIGQTRKPTVLIIGDSIAYGYQDSYTPSVAGDLGKIAPSIGASLAYIMAARISDSAVDFLASNAKRVSLAQYVTHVIGAHGRNDLDKGRSTAQVEADILSVASLFTVPVWWDTVSPLSTSTDSWATVANQTTASTNTKRGQVNNWLRGVPAGLAGVFDTCAAIENDVANNDGKWKAGPITGDGQHPNPAGYAAIKTAGVINAGLIRR